MNRTKTEIVKFLNTNAGFHDANKICEGISCSLQHTNQNLRELVQEKIIFKDYYKPKGKRGYKIYWVIRSEKNE